MALRFRRSHILALLEGFQQANSTPLDSYIRRYLAQNKAIGAHDRREITDTVYELTRHHLYLETTAGSTSWEDMLNKYIEPQFNAQRLESTLPAYIKHSFPLELYRALLESYGNQTESLLAALNTRAPLTIRVNTLKTTLDDLMGKLKKYGEIGVKKCIKSPCGLQFSSRAVNLIATEEYKQGLFELQDEGSQLCALQVEAQPGQSVLDFCAGAGGKSLAIASKLKHTGQLYLYDIRSSPLQEATKRLKRAGVKNAKIVTDLAFLKGQFDYVVTDVPCSSTGTLRRNPDLKRTFRSANLQIITSKQFEIVAQALKYLKQGGELVYMTCSLLKQENCEQVRQIKAHFGLLEASPVLQTDPLTSDMDGFFSVRLKRI